MYTINFHLNVDKNETLLSANQLNIYFKDSKMPITRTIKYKIEHKTYEVTLKRIKITNLTINNVNNIFTYNIIYYQNDNYSFDLSFDELIKKMRRFRIEKYIKKTRLKNIEKEKLKPLEIPKLLIIRSNYKRILYLLVTLLLSNIFCKYILISIKFLLSEPLGIKQNTIFNHLIGNFIIKSYNISNSKDTSNILNLHNLYFIFQTKLITKIIFRLYNKIIQLIIEIFYIFQSRNYNVIKKRTDQINYKCDRIILATFLLCLLLVAIYNLIGYYLMCLVIVFVFECFVFLGNFLDVLRVDCEGLRKNMRLERRKGIFYCVGDEINFSDRVKVGLRYAFSLSIFYRNDILKRIIIGKT